MSVAEIENPYEAPLAPLSVPQSTFWSKWKLSLAVTMTFACIFAFLMCLAINFSLYPDSAPYLPGLTLFVGAMYFAYLTLAGLAALLAKRGPFLVCCREGVELLCGLPEIDGLGPVKGYSLPWHLLRGRIASYRKAQLPWAKLTDVRVAGRWYNRNLFLDYQTGQDADKAYIVIRDVMIASPLDVVAAVIRQFVDDPRSRESLRSWEAECPTQSR